MDWGAAHEPALAVALVGATFHLFSRLALLHENRRRAEALLPLIDTLDLPTDDLADFLRAHSRHLRDSSIAALHAAAQRAASLFRHSGNRHGLYQTLFSIASAFRGFEAQASAAAQEMAAIEQADWPPALRALGCIARSMAASAEQRMADSRAALEAALALAEPAGADRLSVVALMNLADLALLSDTPAEAVQRGQALIALLHRRRDQAQLPFVQCNLANAHLQLGDTASARQLLSQALAAMRRQQWTWLRAFGDVYALLAARQGRADDAARLIGWADAVRQQRGPRQPNEARCRERAWQIVNHALPAAELAACLAAGVAMAPEAVVIATLGSPAAAQPG